MKSKPLLTFAIGAFRQERFVREAVQAAFAQTYSPLEIILSDDCSEDGTFTIMREMAGAYRGPHRVVLNRNPVRRSIGGHINRLVELSHGELIVLAAGDDISLPQRTQVVYEAWEQSGRKATSIHSNIFQIDEDGRTIEQIYKGECEGQPQYLVEQRVEPLSYVRTLDPLVYGCAHAFSRQLFAVFGNLPEEVIHEDNALAFRSILAGRLLYINAPLVRYRVHGNNVFIKRRREATDLHALNQQEERLRRDLKNRETMYRGFILDLEKAKLRGLIANADFEASLAEAGRIRRRYSLQREFLERGLVAKCGILFRLWRLGLSKSDTKRLVGRLVPRALLLRTRLARGYTALALGRSP